MFLLCRMFTSLHPLRRCVGKQTPADPEVQLRDVVWSDESFFRLREIRTRGSVWGQPCLAIVSAHVFLAIFGASVESRVGFGAFLGDIAPTLNFLELTVKSGSR